MEVLKKNFVLLSKIAKEKKYAQEYLGLLARRGDLGSIRIGKRWYTKREWFSEFLADAKERKNQTKSLGLAESADERQEEKKELADKKTEFPERIEEFSVKIENSVDISQRGEKDKEKILNLETDCSSLKKLKQEEKVENLILKKEKEVETVAVPKIVEPAPVVIELKPVFKKPFVSEKKFETIDLRNRKDSEASFQERSFRQLAGEKKILEKKVQMPKEENYLLFEDWLSGAEQPSPNFFPTKTRLELFPRFAFSLSMLLLLILLAQLGWVYKNEIREIFGGRVGTVAGVQDKRVNNLDTIKNSSADYLEEQSGKIKENISLSGVLIRAAIEKGSSEDNESRERETIKSSVD